MSARKKPALSPTSPHVLLIALTKAEDYPDVLRGVVPAGAKLVTQMLDGKVEPLSIDQAAERLIVKAHKAANLLELSVAFQEDLSVPVATRDALSILQGMSAEAGFALGLALGQRLAGGAR